MVVESNLFNGKKTLRKILTLGSGWQITTKSLIFGSIKFREQMDTKVIVLR